LPNQTFEQCLAACAAEDTCTGFAFNTGPGDCYRKTGTGAYVVIQKKAGEVGSEFSGAVKDGVETIETTA